MQYKMQFTVLDDAVKQNRKLPEIAFFDTDGNLIHLGGDGGGDVSALLPLDGSREMSGQLGISHEDPNDGSIYLNPDGWAYFWDPTPDASVLSVAGVGTGDWPTLIVKSDGRLQWSDGTLVPDVSLERVIEETGYFGLSSDPAALQIDSPIKFHERGGLAEDITLGWTSGLAHRGGPHPALAMLGEILHIEPNGDNPDGMWLTLAADPIGGNEVGLYLGGPIHNCEIKTNASGGLHYQAPEHKFDQQISIAQPGAGIKLTSPDGSQTKTVRLSNAGELELV